jgi:outer membrane protein assembly factor BamA
MNFFTPPAALLALVLFAYSAVAQDGEAVPNPDAPFMHLDLQPNEDGLEGGDFELISGPLTKLTERWPEDLVIAPVPGRSPQTGWTLALGGGYFIGRSDDESESPPSLVGGFAWFAENGSYAYGAGANLHLLDDKLRIKAGAGYVDVRYRFYGKSYAENKRGLSVGILQTAPLYFATGTWKVWKRLYLGLGYMSSNVDSRVRLGTELPFGDPSLEVGLGAINIPVQWDSRDHEQFPTRGWLLNGRVLLYREAFGGDVDAETAMFNVNHYRRVGERDVIAFRAYARTSSGDAPFFLLSTFGGSQDLRGYPAGRYRDRLMYALQAEYRKPLNESWIVTGFAGFGEVAEELSGFGEHFLPAAGVGIRYVVSRKHRVSLSSDIAFGKHGAEFYFGIGEAF